MTAKHWLPPGYKVPKPPSDYMRFEDGANKFRVMSEVIMGYEYWNKEGKPVRLHEYPTEEPADIRYVSVKQKDGSTVMQAERIKHFWAFVVWNYAVSRIQVLELTQAGIQKNIQDLVTNEDWGAPTDYDITITKTGQKLDTEYTVQPSPHKPVPDEAVKAYEASKIDLSKLFEGKDVVEDPSMAAWDNTVDGERTVE